ncbi:MAG: hypothetical protein MUF83_16000 [Acidimicrobiales bacterium]|jgi:fructose-1,6-bisphosphatase/inositol monophosphatase family enzyme|nr:hypothetical protein [Acidimicrobiales bacterium]
MRARLCALGDVLRDVVVANRDAGLAMSTVEGKTTADTIYGIDRVADEALVAWFERHWPDVLVVSEGLEAPVAVGTPRCTVIVDTIDGTRGLMYDKRSAWVLAAVAPLGGRSGDVVAAAMTEIPTTKQWAADQFSATRGDAAQGRAVHAERLDVRSGRRAPLTVRPSQATTLEHGWASFARFFPPAKVLVAAFEERLWHELYGEVPEDLAVFDDQYVSTGGQLAELLVGHDRMLGDVRPLAFAELGLASAVTCHPYDICTALLLEEAGGVVTDPWGDPLDVPLDTTTAVAWVGYANPRLAALLGPAVRAAAEATFPGAHRG